MFPGFLSPRVTHSGDEDDDNNVWTGRATARKVHSDWEGGGKAANSLLIVLLSLTVYCKYILLVHSSWKNKTFSLNRFIYMKPNHNILRHLM